MSTKRFCRDCVGEGRPLTRAAPHPGPRCATHHRQVTHARKVASHERRVVNTYGLEPGDYWRLYEFQGGVCAGCQRATGASKRLAVDHNHASGEVRGLLCGRCNQLVGYFRDDPTTFNRLATYLVDPPARRLKLGTGTDTFGTGANAGASS